MRTPRFATFRGRRYTILPKNYGFVDEGAREIHIDERLKGYSHLFVLTHEATHAALPNLSEEVVERVGREISKLIWRYGYRRVK